MDITQPLSSTTKKRDSNLELYRVLVMLLIIAHHYVVNSGLTSAGGPIYAAPQSFRSLFLLVFGAFGKTGINCFVLITGYFMCKKTISANKFFKLLFEIEFYNIAIYFIFLATKYETLSWKSLSLAIFPIRDISTGFYPCFLLFFLCIPFLNILIHHITERQHIYLLILSLFIYTFFGTLPSFSVRMNYVSWFIVLYFIAAYIRLYPKKAFEKKWLWLLLTVISLLLCAGSIILRTWSLVEGTKSYSYFFVEDSNTLLAVVTAVCSFMLFKNLRVKYNPVINAMGASCFGVLLIHANSDAMRKWLWRDFLKNVDMYYSKWLYLHAILSVLAIFLVCFVIDYCRRKFIEKPFFVLWDKLWKKISRRYKSVEEKVFEKLHIQ